MVRAFTLAAVLFATCTPQQQPVPDDAAKPATTTDVYQDVCAHLKTVHCPEGEDPNCAPTLQRASRIEDFHLTCLLQADSGTAVAKCGPGVPCKQR